MIIGHIRVSLIDVYVEKNLVASMRKLKTQDCQNKSFLASVSENVSRLSLRKRGRFSVSNKK